MSSERETFARLAAGPRVLLLGQGTSDFVRNEDAVSDQMDAVDEGVPAAENAPSSLESVVGIPWNGVFTSRISQSVARWFDASWRRIVPTASLAAGRNPRSTTELQVRYLFGGLGLPEDERPPSDDIEQIDAQRRAADMLSTLVPQVATPKGIILVEDWTLTDWLTPTDLFNLASRVGAGQLHLFSSTEEIRANKLIRASLDRGQITCHDESLEEFLRAAVDRGILSSTSDQADTTARLIPAGEGFVSIDIGTWNRVLTSARPVDVEVLEPFTPAPGPLDYQRFRAFLGSAEGVPPWRAVASGFKLKRTYEEELFQAVNEALDLTDPGPVVLQGQTATGKSLSLVWLAQELAKSGRAAVLYQSRRRDRPAASDLEEYSVWADEVANLKTVLIWDGMVGPDDYFALDRQLRARGRRVLIVGTSYVGPSAGARSVLAPPNLDSAEALAVTPWLTQHGISAPVAMEGADTSFLALLYRTLPETEAGFRKGLALEMRAAESGVEDLARSRRNRSQNRLGAIAAALADAGFDIDSLAPSERPDEELTQLGFAERSQTEQLSAMLLVAGRYGLAVPLELALRVVGKGGSEAIVDYVRQFDIFRWTEDESGRQFLGVRTRLEAELLAREDISADVEVQVICTLVEHVKPSLSARSGGDEVQFVVDVMEQVGPQSRDTGRFARWYGDFADAFKLQRSDFGSVHPRLALQEANLLREYVQRSQNDETSTHQNRMLLLQECEGLLLTALELGDVSTRARLNLFVELASSYGSQIYELVNDENSDANSDVIQGLVERLFDSVQRAREVDPENIYPIDVLAWSAKAAVGSGLMPRHSKLELIADAKASLDSLDPSELSPGQRAAYSNRQAEMARLLDDPELEQQYLRDLLANDDPAAYYLLAVRAAAPANGPEGLQLALDSLMKAPEAIREDWKCARLILDLFWRAKAGTRLLSGDREAVPFSSREWEESLQLVNSLGGTAAFDEYRLMFVRGLALFHLGSVKRSQDEFAVLGSRGIDLSRRVHLAYLASNSDGTPAVFTGRVTWASADGRRGRAWVDQISAEIDFVPIRFSASDFRSRNEVLPEFHIGFNFRGPVADPIRRRIRPGSPR